MRLDRSAVSPIIKALKLPNVLSLERRVIIAERRGQLDRHSLLGQSVGVLTGSPLFVVGKFP